MTTVKKQVEDINWPELCHRIDHPEAHLLEARMRKIESKVERNRVSIKEIDPLRDMLDNRRRPR